MNSILIYNENDTKNDSVLNHINFGKDYSDELDRIFVAINNDQKNHFPKGLWKTGCEYLLQTFSAPEHINNFKTCKNNQNDHRNFYV